jgi:hypothetical protein
MLHHFMYISKPPIVSPLLSRVECCLQQINLPSLVSGGSTWQVCDWSCYFCVMHCICMLHLRLTVMGKGWSVALKERQTPSVIQKPTFIASRLTSTDIVPLWMQAMQGSCMP